MPHQLFTDRNQTLVIKRNDDGTPIEFHLRDRDHQPQDLTGRVVGDFNIRLKNLITGVLTTVLPDSINTPVTAGIITLSTLASVVPNIVTFAVEVEMDTDGAGALKTFPETDAQLQIEIIADLV